MISDQWICAVDQPVAPPTTTPLEATEHAPPESGPGAMLLLQVVAGQLVAVVLILLRHQLIDASGHLHGLRPPTQSLCPPHQNPTRFTFASRARIQHCAKYQVTSSSLGLCITPIVLFYNPPAGVRRHVSVNVTLSRHGPHTNNPRPRSPRCMVYTCMSSPPAERYPTIAGDC